MNYNLLVSKIEKKLVESLETHGIIDGVEMRVEFNGVSKVGLFYGLKLEMNNAVNIFLTFVDITELINTSNALKQREELYSTLMENMNEAVLQTDLEDKVIYVNNRFEKVLGYNPNEVLGKSIYQFLLDEAGVDFVQRANENRKNKEYEQYEMKLKHKNGHYLNFLISASPVIDPNGEVLGSIGVMTDITEMLKAIDQLKASEEKFRLIAENSADVISIQTIDGKFKYLSPSCHTILGYYPDELIGLTPIFFIKPEYKERFLKLYSQENLNRSSYTVAFEATAKNGKDIWLEATAIVVKDVDNNPKEIQTLTRDITDRKKIELDLEDAIRFNNLVINSLPIALISVERNLTVSLFNEAALQYKKDIKGEEKLFNLFPILNLVKTKIQETILNKIQTESHNTIADENGELKYLKFIISPIERLGKYGCVVLIDDITHFRNMEQLMIQSEKMMSVAGLAAGMAHEINNPLGTIVQGCQNIIRRVSKELPKNIETARNLGVEIELIDSYFQQRQIFEIIESMRFASAKAADIIKNMLQFSRKSESKMVMYSVESLLEQTSELANSDYDFKKKYDYKSINVIKEYQPGLPEIKMTVTEMEQVVFNLIRNAVQAMRNDEASNKIPTIILRTLRDEKYVKIEVEDNGPGIPEKIISRIFEPFFTTKEVGEGTGLGLSVSYMIVTKNHKGKIEVDSKIGKGTKFIIKLPI